MENWFVIITIRIRIQKEPLGEVSKMSRVVSIGAQNFEKIILNNYFYVDKTLFIKEWWESGNEVTLIARPRRFGPPLILVCWRGSGASNIRGRENFFRI